MNIIEIESNIKPVKQVRFQLASPISQDDNESDAIFQDDNESDAVYSNAISQDDNESDNEYPADETTNVKEGGYML